MPQLLALTKWRVCLEAPLSVVEFALPRLMPGKG